MEDSNTSKKENKENVWYNVKQVNGQTIIEKIEKKNICNEDSPTKEIKNENDQPLVTKAPVRYVYKEVPKKKSKGKIWLTLGLSAFVLLIVSVLFLTMGNSFGKTGSKNRTIMIYMVGSDLETDGSMGTYDLKDITSSNVNLEENNVVLMVGGAKKWHNFVRKDEIGIYNLTKDGFKKLKSLELSSMGGSETLSSFLDYSYNEFPAEKYDLIFWNHGLGSVGIQHDEIYDKIIYITDLDKAFKESPFKDEKLELVIFNDCLGGNIHFANIMKNYAEYMVASEESMYVALGFDRLNFIEKIKKDDNGYDVGKHYIDQSDKSQARMKSAYYQNLESTLSIIDLNKVSNLNNKLNEFFDSIDLDIYYNQVSRARAKTHTYGLGYYEYDTVDIYELVEALRPYSNDQTLVSDIKKELKKVVKYNSANDKHSNGLSIYFPYYGKEVAVETHIELFNNLWKNEYTKFITDYYDITSELKRARRAASGSNINKLKNKGAASKSTVILQLNDSEKEKFERANVYIFEKDNDEYKLLLKSNKVNLVNNNLVYNHYAVIKDENNNKITLVDENDLKMYASLDDKDVIAKVKLEKGMIEFVNFLLDSKVPSMSIVERNESSELSMYSLKYDLFEENELKEDWKDTLKKEKIEFDNSKKLTAQEGLNGYYILIEMYDINNDVYYSDLIKA